MTSEQKLRILAIHGYRQSDTIFSGKLGSLRKSFKQKIDFKFIRAPHLVPPLESAEEQQEETEAYGWWFNTKENYFKATDPSDMSVGFEESVSLVERSFQEFGPFDGILGFSQGASFVSILCALQQKKLSPVKFDFAILISGFKSLCEPHSYLYNETLKIPTLHVFGEGDKIIPVSMARELADTFDTKKVITHEGGHYVPGRKQIYSDFVAEMMAIKNQP